MTGPGQILAGLLLATAGMQDTTSQERAGAEAEAQERTRAEAEAQERVIAEELEHLDEHLRFDGQADNAATHYRELFRELIRRRYLDERLDEAVWALENELLSDRELYEAPAMQEYLGEVERYREGLRKAIGTERVDFGIRREVGFDLLLPHLNHVRDLSRKLERTSRKLRIDGRMAESAEDLILMLGMAAHAAEDGVIISSLVGAATASEAMNQVELALTDRQIDPVIAEQLLVGFRPLDGADPFHYRDALQGEYELLETTFMEGVLAPEDLEETIGEILDMLDENAWSGLWDEGGMDRARVLEEIRLTRPLYQRLGDLVTLENRLAARRETREIMIAVERGEYGVFNMVVMPGIGTTIDTKHYSDQLIEYLVDSLRAIRNGADPKRFGNAALVHEGVIERLPRRLRAEEQTVLEMVRQMIAANGSCRQVDESLRRRAATVLERESELLGTIRRAAGVERCSWRRARMAALKERAIGEGDWVRPMRAMVRLMLADAAIGFCTTDRDRARARVEGALVAALGLCLQLSDGTHLFGQLAATAALEEFESILVRACEARLVSRPVAEAMHERLQRSATTNLDHWRLAGDAMLDEDLFDLIQRFRGSDRAEAMDVGRRFSRDRLMMLPFFTVEAAGPEHPVGTLEVRCTFANETDSSPDRGELFLVEDILKLDAERRRELERPVRRIAELLERIDALESPNVAEWQLRSAACLERLDAILVDCGPGIRGGRE